MKPIRIIERVAYGDDTHDELADVVPPWDDIFRARRAIGDNEGPAGAFPTPLHHRFWSAAKVAAAAGCPPHWADMGMRAEGDAWHIDLDDDLTIIVGPEEGASWFLREIQYGFHDRVVLTEFDARCRVADYLDVEWGAK